MCIRCGAILALRGRKSKSWPTRGARGRLKSQVWLKIFQHGYADAVDAEKVGWFGEGAFPVVIEREALAIGNDFPCALFAHVGKDGQLRPVGGVGIELALQFGCARAGQRRWIAEILRISPVAH